jgi:hypothetical protein
MTFRNEAGATFIAVSNNAFTTWERAHTFENFGTFVKSNGTATTACNWLFNNSGALDLQSGTLALNISPTGFTGGTLRFALGGTTPGVDHGKLALAGSQSLGGSVDVSLKNGFTPAPGNTFALVIYGTRMGGFSPISFASVLGADWFSRYDAAGFIVGVRAPVSCLSITNGLIAWWTGDGGTNVLASGNVTPSNGATNDIGFNGQAFHLDGNDDYWSVPDSTNFRPANLTVEGWVSFNGYGGLRTFFGKPYGSGPQDSFTVWLDGTTLRAVVTTPSGFGPILGYPFTPEIGRWYHIAFTFDDTNDLQTLYLDGAPVASGTVTESIVYDTRPLVIGADIENGSYAFFHNGFIDEVTLYDRPLSAMEIASIHRADSVGRCTSTPTLTNFAQLIAPTWSNGVFRTTIVAQNQAARAVVLASENLVTWTPIQTNAPFTGTFLLVDPSATTNRFYRLRIE